MSKLKRKKLTISRRMSQEMVHGPDQAIGTIRDMLCRQHAGEFRAAYLTTADIVEAELYGKDHDWTDLRLEIRSEWAQDTGDECFIILHGKKLETDAQLAKRQREHDSKIERDRVSDEKAIKKIQKRNPDLLGVSDE